MHRFREEGAEAVRRFLVLRRYSLANDGKAPLFAAEWCQAAVSGHRTADRRAHRPRAWVGREFGPRGDRALIRRHVSAGAGRLVHGAPRED